MPFAMPKKERSARFCRGLRRKFAGPPQGFVKHYPDARREVEAAHGRVDHRDRKTGFRVCREQAFRQTARFRAEDETIVDALIEVEVWACRLGRQVEEPRPRKARVHRREVDVTMKLDLVPIIEPSPLQCAIVHPEAGNAHNVKRRSRGRAQPCYVAGVGRDLGFVQSDVHRPVRC